MCVWYLGGIRAKAGNENAKWRVRDGNGSGRDGREGAEGAEGSTGEGEKEMAFAIRDVMVCHLTPENCTSSDISH